MGRPHGQTYRTIIHGGQQLLKSVDTLDHIRKRKNESLWDFYTYFNKDLASIDQVIIDEGETIRALVRALRPKGTTLYDILSIIPFIMVENMTARAKLYIDQELNKKGKKALKESKKEVQEAKKPQQHNHKNNQEDHGATT